jgi:hypothetical protein
MNAILFAIVSFISVLIYYPIASAAKWKQRGIVLFKDAYWNAFQCFVYALAIMLIRGGPSPTIWAVLPILPTTLIYGLISEQPGMNFDLTGNTPFTSGQIALLTIFGILFGIYAIVIIYSESVYGSLQRLLPLLLFIIWILSWLGINKSEDSTSVEVSSFGGGYSNAFKRYVPGGTETSTISTTYNLHFHHWMISIVGVLLSISPSEYSQFVSGIFWGIFCQEAAAYGIMIPSDSRQSTQSQTTENQLGPGGTHTG